MTGAHKPWSCMGSWAWTIHNACFNHHWEFYIHFQKPSLFKGSKKITDNIFYIFSLKKLCVDYKQVSHVRGNHVAVSSLIPKIAAIQNDVTAAECNFPKYLCILVQLIRLSTEHFFNLFIIQRRNQKAAANPTVPNYSYR